jgi:ribosomal protein S18 acetylase RimI-like enzyme
MADVTRGALTLLLATANDVDAVFALYQACTAAMLERGIRQWDSGYPDRATCGDAAARGDLFLLVDRTGLRPGSDVVGSVILNELAAPEYASIVWRTPTPALIVHTLVIDPGRQGGGLGRAAMAACEAFARARGFASVRLDAYPGNAAAIALYDRLGYERRGDVHFGFKPPGHQRYAVYEKPM